MASLEPRENDRPVRVEFADGMLRVTLSDGREIATPLDWYPNVLNATPEQRVSYRLSFSGIHWDDLDEDLSIAGMLRGNRPRYRRGIMVEHGN